MRQGRHRHSRPLPRRPRQSVAHATPAPAQVGVGLQRCKCALIRPQWLNCTHQHSDVGCPTTHVAARCRRVPRIASRTPAAACRLSRRMREAHARSECHLPLVGLRSSADVRPSQPQADLRAATQWGTCQRHHRAHVSAGMYIARIPSVVARTIDVRHFVPAADPAPQGQKRAEERHG